VFHPIGPVAETVEVVRLFCAFHSYQAQRQGTDSAGFLSNKSCTVPWGREDPELSETVGGSNADTSTPLPAFLFLVSSGERSTGIWSGRQESNPRPKLGKPGLGNCCAPDSASEAGIRPGYISSRRQSHKRFQPLFHLIVIMFTSSFHSSASSRTAPAIHAC
jgi:hypothetical protein